jgi:hypothetical protein
MELLCFRAAEAVESAALMVLHTLSTHRPQEMLQTLLGLLPALDPNDPLWLGRMANIATLLETVPPYDTIQTLGTCLRALYALQDLRRVIADDLAGRLTRATWYIYWVVCLFTEQYVKYTQAVQTIADLQVRYSSSRVWHTSFCLSEVTTCSRFWTYRLGSRVCRLSWMIGMLKGCAP